MNPHNRIGFHWSALFDGNWEMKDRGQLQGKYMSLVVGVVNALGFVLERRGDDPLRFRQPPFPGFSYAVALTDESVVVLLGRSPIQSVRYAYYEDVRNLASPRTTEAALNQLREQLPWDDIVTTHFPANILALAEPERTRLMEAAAEHIAAEVSKTPMVAGARSELQPIAIFPTSPFTRDERLCFVLMPFNEELREVYDVGIRAAVEGAGLKCRRADDIAESGDVLAQIYGQLRAARIVVADLTGANGNVLYELGLAHMMGHQVILLTQRLADVPFDLRQQRHIVYEHTIKGVNALYESLSRSLAMALREGKA